MSKPFDNTKTPIPPVDKTQPCTCGGPDVHTADCRKRWHERHSPWEWFRMIYRGGGCE